MKINNERHQNDINDVFLVPWLLSLNIVNKHIILVFLVFE